MSEVKGSFRLTNLDRDEIISAAIKGAFAKRDEDIAKAEDRLAPGQCGDQVVYWP